MFQINSMWFVLWQSLERFRLPCITFNVLPDHLHALVVVRKGDQLAVKAGNMKGYISYRFRKEKTLVSRMWAKGFHKQWIQSDQHLTNVKTYIENNHFKHESRWGRGFLCGFRDEFREIVQTSCESSRKILGGRQWV